MVPAFKGDAYPDLLMRTGVSDYRATPGNRGVTIFRRDDGAVTHFFLLTYWESMDAVRAFAGDDPEKARYYPEDRDFLLEFEPTVTHYEVVYSVGVEADGGE